MNKQKNNEFLILLSQISVCARNNTEALLSLINGKSAEIKYADKDIISKTLKKLENTYFTPIEREDIFSVLCAILRLSESIADLYKKVTTADVFNLSSDERQRISDLKTAVFTCDNMINQLSFIPECPELTDDFFKIREICKNQTVYTQKSLLVKKINNCFELCLNSAEVIFNTYLKNT